MLEGGEIIRSRAVVSNADPKVTLGLLGDAAPAGVPRHGSTAGGPPARWSSSTAGCRGCRDGRALPDADWPNRAPVSITVPMDDAQAAFDDCTRGIPSPGFAELYFQTAYDPTVAPPGKHTMSRVRAVRAVRPRRGHLGHPARRDRPAGPRPDRRATATSRSCVEHIEVLGPPDIEERVGLTGGHIFQGECTPDQMWWRRLAPRTPMRRRLPVRRGDAPGRQRDRPQRPQRRHGRPRRPRLNPTKPLNCLLQTRPDARV